MTKKIADILVEENINYVVSLPDSILSGLCKELISNKDIFYIQTTHEADCVGIASGLSLTGKKVVVVMESSGLRTAFEIISRFQLSHSIHCIYIISNRGEFGERNWWGQPHYYTTEIIINALNFRHKLVNSIEEFRVAIKEAINSFLSNQVSPIIILGNKFFLNY